MKIVFFGTANVALPILEKLNKEHQVLAVVTNPDAPAGRSQSAPSETPVSALARDLKLTTLKPEKIRGNQDFTAGLDGLNADIFVVVAYGKILPAEVISMPPLKTVNVHFSALPKYRGPSPIQFALLNGERQTGTSIFILDEHMDTGPLLAQKIVDIEPDDNYFTLSDRLARISADLLTDTLSDYQAGRVTPLPQDESRVSYSRIITKQDGKVDWQKTAPEIYNQFRAFYPWPGIWTTFQGKKLKILDCVANPESPKLSGTAGACGTVIDGGTVVCGSGTTLKIRSLQPEGKKEMAIGDFLNGYKNFIGSKLE